jgi:hypothetical protein
VASSKGQEIWAVAGAVIAKHGERAADYAQQRAKQAVDEDNRVAYGIWLSVKQAIDELTRSPGPADRPN